MGDIEEPITPKQWPNDVADRKPYADFLTKYLINKTTCVDGKHTKSFTLALDAQWGQGKTFFVKHWAEDLEKATPPYLTLYFDAWSEDYASEPIVAFMAAFKSTIDAKLNQLASKKALKKKVTEQLSNAVHGMRRALLPAGKQVLTSVITKASGVAVDELIDQFKSDASEINNSDAIKKAGLEVLNQGLDKFFEKTLEEQNDRKAAIKYFKNSIATALSILSTEGGIRLPMFIFVDEIDRCRPSFAISMLEGIKHLFDIDGACYVVSTNMTQLAHAVKSVYGEDFDGHGYLKRLFEAEYTLPSANNYAHVNMLLKQHPQLTTRAVTGIPRTLTGIKDRSVTSLDALTWVADVFDLDFRSQEKVVEMMSAASTGILQERKIFILWLSILCALRHKKPSAFDAISESKLDRSAFGNIVTQAITFNKEIEYREPSRTDHGTRKQSIIDVAWTYYAAAWENLETLEKQFYQSESHPYPSSLLEDIIREMPSYRYTNHTYIASITSYFHLVRNAGHFKSSQ